MQRLGNSSQLRGSNFLSERSYSLKWLNSIYNSTPVPWRRQAAGADVLGNAVLTGHFRRQEGMGFETNTEQEQPAMGTKQALGGGSEGWE